MTIPYDFDYQRPRNLSEALELLEKHGSKASPLAGGTDLVVNMEYRSILQLVEGAGFREAKFPAARRVQPMQRPEIAISLADLTELCGVTVDKDVLRIGPTTTMAQIAALGTAPLYSTPHPDIPQAVKALQDAAGVMGSPLIRNRATIGGNLINARPAADTAVAALALDGRLELASTKGNRWVKLSAFFTGVGTSVRRPDELLVAIEIPWSPNAGSAYLRQGTRRQLEIALVGAASWVRLDPASGTVADARIALGAVAPTPLLATHAASTLIHQKPTSDVLSAAAVAARNEAKPIDDYRGSAAYRLELIEVLVRRSLEVAVSRAGGQGGRP